MRSRLVWQWTALAAVAQAAVVALYSSGIGLQRYNTVELATAFSLVAVPAAQWIALRAAHVTWRREWAFSTLAGYVFAGTAADLFQWSAPGGLTMGGYSILAATGTALCQWIVLRRHAARASWWLAGSAAAYAVGRAGMWLAFGTFVPRMMQPAPLQRAAIAAAGALVEAIVFAWIVLRPNETRTAPVSAPGNVWRWVEWTASATVTLLVIMGSSGLIESAFTDRAYLAAVVARPLLALVAGLAIGVVQWALLRDRLALPPAWIAVSAAALVVLPMGIVVPIVGVFVFYGWLVVMQMPGGTALVGAWFGFCQWLLLRRYAKHAAVWIPATALAWSAFYLRNGAPGISGLSLTAVGVAIGGLSGIAAVNLSRRTRPLVSVAE